MNRILQYHISENNPELNGLRHINLHPFGMTISERSYTNDEASYRFGFNGMEKDNEVKGEGNSLDFGARIYDCRLGRWLSLDIYEAGYPFLSPFTFAANSPLYILDPNGKENVIYLVLLPGTVDSKGKPITKETMMDIRDEINSRFKDMKLKTTVVIIEYSEFDMKKMDETDAVVYYGNEQALINEAKKVGKTEVAKEMEKNIRDDLEQAKLGFKPFHVEKGENRTYFLFEDQIDHIKQSGGNICLIKAELIDQYAKSIPDDCAKTVLASWLIMHALGHNAGLGNEHTESPVMYDWKQITNTINFVVNDYYNKLSDFMSSRSDVPNVPTANRNEFYVDAMKRRFGEKDAVPYNKKIGFRDKNSTLDSLNKELEKINSTSTTDKTRVEQKPWKR